MNRFAYVAAAASLAALIAGCVIHSERPADSAPPPAPAPAPEPTAAGTEPAPAPAPAPAERKPRGFRSASPADAGAPATDGGTQ